MTHDLTCKVLDHPGRMCSDIAHDDRINLLPHIHTYIGLPSMCSCGASEDYPLEKCCGKDIVSQGGICVDCPYMRHPDTINQTAHCGHLGMSPNDPCHCQDQPDPINHPLHYTQHPSGVECITITEHYNFNVGNAIKYLWRAGLKDGADATDDLRKAAWYVQREIERPLQPTAAVVYCGLCNASLTSPSCPNQQCPQSPLYDGLPNALR